MTDDPIGREVAGYRIEGVLGQGGMGTVYKATDTALSRPVALKRINPTEANREAFLHRFRSEARALARLNSPHIVAIHALRETEIGLLIVMEYVEGGTVADRIGDGPLPVEKALPYLKQMLRAFEAAHEAEVIHRDIKPQNLLCTPDEVVKVTDFGLAKMRRQDSGETVTQGGKGGTLKYMSPEQVSDVEAVDERSDLYSIGVTAYRMLAGRLPFANTSTDFDIMKKIVEGDLPSPQEVRPSLPDPVAGWITTAIQKEPADRFQTAGAMADALDEVADQISVAPDDGVPPTEALPTAWEPPTIQGDPTSRTADTVPAATEDAPTVGGPTEVDPAVDNTTAASPREAARTDSTARTTQYLLAGLLVVLVGTVGFFAFDRFSDPASDASATESASAPDAVREDALAVMPFQTSGPETDVWREGMMSMLTSNLDGMGGLQAVSPRTVLARIREIGAAGTDLDLKQTLRTARSAGASMALVGSVVSTGETARISAKVHDTESGEAIGRLQVEGAEADFMGLVDRLTVQAVEAARSRTDRDGEAVSVPDVSALTTESLPALRAYLDGERLYRQSKWVEAIPRFEQAIRLDSTFAMAHLRLSDLYYFAGATDGSQAEIRAARAQARKRLHAARRHGETLPPRETALLKSAVAAQIQGDRVRAAQILKEATRRFPTDPEVWYKYGEQVTYPMIAWRTRAGRGTSPFTDADLEANRAALALDSSYTTAYWMPTMSSIARGDTTNTRRLLSAYRRHTDSTSNRFLESFEAADRLVYGDSTQQAQVLQRLRRGEYVRGGAVLFTSLRRDPGPETLRALEELGRVLVEARGHYSIAAAAPLKRGRYRPLRAFIRDTTLTSTSARLSRARSAALLLQRGAIGPEAVPAALAAPLCRRDFNPIYSLMGCFQHARLAAADGRTGTGAHRQAVRVFTETEEALRAKGDAEWADAAAGYRLALEGLAALRRGEPGAHATLDSAHVKLDVTYDVAPAWLPMEVQVSAFIDEDNPARALPYARMIQTRDPYGHYLEGRALEAAGNASAARAAYEQFVHAWRDADPGIPALQYAKAVLAGETAAQAPPL